MLKLLQPGEFNKILNHPEIVSVHDLVQICHQIFLVQTVVGVLQFIPAAYRRTMGLDTCFNVIVPVHGFRHTFGENDDSDRHAMQMAAVYWLVGTLFRWGSAVIGRDVRALPLLLLKSLVAFVQWTAFARLWRLLQDRRMTKQRFYLNVVVENKAEAVKAKAAAKIKSHVLGKLAGKIANKVITDEKFVAAIGKKIESRIQEKMSFQGIYAKAEVQFQKGNVIVVLVMVESVEMTTVVESRAGEERAQLVNKVFVRLPNRVRVELNNAMRSNTAKRLIEKLPDKLATEMKEVGGVEVHVDARAPEEEADFLCALLAQMDAE